MKASLWVAAVLVGAPAAQAQTPPEPLSCVARHYDLTTSYERQSWHLVLPSGARLPYDDGLTKTFEQMLAAPDVQDSLALRYVAGSLEPVTRRNQDPGRVRVDALMNEVYGDTPALVSVTFFAQKVQVHKRVQAALQQVQDALQAALARDPKLMRYLTPLGGGYNRRRIAGTTRKSAHAYGIALDLNPRFAHYWQWDKPATRHWRNQVPYAIVAAFEAAGFIWGGRWYHYDTMHFEYRPELLDPKCQAAP